MTTHELEQILQDLHNLTAETEVAEFKEAKKGMMQVLLTGRND